jgi:peptidoglycan/xylan/chitin deacetylase (PgdA/CDA1 family)
MRVIAALMGALLLVAAGSAAAQPAAQPCLPGAALGVSRTIEIDAASGPRFGQLQYKDFDFLEDGEIVLTFDDGPLRHNTLAVLDALAAHCTKATFFLVGRMALSDPEMVREIGRRGHTIGTHTWSHRNLKSVLAAQARGEIELGISAVQRALGAPIAPFFRFPYLSDPKGMQDYLGERRIALFSIDADSFDYRTQNPATVQRSIVRQLLEKRKGIVLFHDIQPSTANALKGLLDELKARGFRVVHIIPKVPATSLADYDAMADKAFAEKRVAAAGHPLARRSVVWPLSAGEVQPSGSLVTRSGGGPERPAPRGEEQEEENWQAKVFRR